MAQFVAGAFSEAILAALQEWAVVHQKQNELDGLLASLCTFELSYPSESDKANDVHPILAVCLNIISRGAPTIASLASEELLSERFGIISQDESALPTIAYTVSNELEADFSEKIFAALHLIVPQEAAEGRVLYTADLDSDFEAAFLQQYITDGVGYLRQLFQHQRPLNTLGRPIGNDGRADFCIEEPYVIKANMLNRYNEEVTIEARRTHLTEVDGAAFHDAEIDALRDFETQAMRATTSRIRQHNAWNDARQFVRNIAARPFVARIVANWSGSSGLRQTHYEHALLPLAVQRLQFTLCKLYAHIISKGGNLERTAVRVAIVDRDIVCGEHAVNVFLEIVSQLNILAEEPLALPKIDFDYFNSEHALEPNLAEAYDFIIDTSVLQRLGVFATDDEFPSHKTWRVRSSHFRHHDTLMQVHSAKPVRYKSVSKEVSAEVYADITETCDALCYFLQNIFRKTEFREGQLPIINRALQLKSVIGLLPTGGGKSLTYQLPAMLQPGITVVVDPIRSLMQDQYIGLHRIGITKCSFINSTLSRLQKEQAQKDLALGGTQIVFVSPERFVIQEFRDAAVEAFSNGHFFSYCVIDEVHCVSEWGHDFRPPYLSLGANAVAHCRRADGLPVPIFGLTATASFDVLADIERELQIQNDDGGALVRHENTVRNEILFSVKEIVAQFEPAVDYNTNSIKQSVGMEKRRVLNDAVRRFSSHLEAYSSTEQLNTLVSKAYHDYVPDVVKRGAPDDGVEALSEESYSEKQLASLPLKTDAWSANGTSDIAKYNYGVIVFCPHRKGTFGVLDVKAQMDVEQGVQKVGFFVGSGDDGSDDFTKESFENLEQFLESRQSVMVATKAFGMGIDKASVRLTYHLNLPSSIESFVQESGRAARDRHLALSTILFNRQHFAKNPARAYQLKADGDYAPDKELVDYFHRLSFQGADREMQVLDELLDAVTFPLITRLEDIEAKLLQLRDVDVKLEFGRRNWEDVLFIKGRAAENNIAFWNLRTNGTQYYAVFAEEEERQLLQDVWNYLPGYSMQHWEGTKAWLLELVHNEAAPIGILTKLAAAKDNSPSELNIPFTNRFHSRKLKVGDKWVVQLNPEHQAKFMACPIVAELGRQGKIDNTAFNMYFESAVKAGDDFKGFVERFNVADELKAIVYNDNELRHAYNLSRDEKITGKAIYRLRAINIIHDYTIDFNRKIYRVFFKKQSAEEYLESLQGLFARYTSDLEAARLIAEIKAKKTAAGTHPARVVLRELTSFVYAQIEEKRKQAAKDMWELCEDSLNKTDLLAQSEEIKERIFYYFNAKYSRVGYKAILKASGLPVDASLPGDSALSIQATIDKYIRLTEEESGTFKTHVKHLRGASQRMIRSYPSASQYYMLLAFCLLVQSRDTPELLPRATDDILKGLSLWKAADEGLDVTKFLKGFRLRVEAHVDKRLVRPVFEQIEATFLISHYNNWLEQSFIPHFLENYPHGISERT